jgi:Protein of unknown function (DUF2934)
MATRRTTGPTRTTPTAPPAEKAAPSRRGAAAKAGEGASKGVTGAAAGITVSIETRRAMIAQAAYLRAERRGFTGGGEEEDWLAAEAEVDALLRAGNGRPPQ